MRDYKIKLMRSKGLVCWKRYELYKNEYEAFRLYNKHGRKENARNGGRL